MSTLRITVLGCGSSGGVPIIGCDCPVCTSDDPRNKRTRVSVLLEKGDTTVLVDTSPDCRQQLLAAKVRRLDAVIFTHMHADHVHGIDEIRSINYLMNKTIDAWADRRTLDRLQQRFGYCFTTPDAPPRYYVPQLVAREVRGPFQVGALTIQPFAQSHGGDRDPTMGLRVGPFAYSTDVKTLPEPAFAVLQGVDCWVVDCLRERPNPGHSHLEQTLGWIDRVQPRHAVLTHMNHSVDYNDWKARLPAHVEPGYDGLVLEIPD